MRTEVAQRRIEAFRKRFGEAHLYLAYHAAFPLALTPDLLYRLWANFQRDIHGEILNIPWIAVADLLLSSLCDEVGHELYEMEKEVRNALLSELKTNPRFGTERINELSDFLLAYVQQQLDSPDIDTRDFAQAQRWTALAYTRSSEAARELASALSRAYEQDRVELVRMASLVETLAEPLAEFEPLLVYARRMESFARDDLEDAAIQRRELPRQKAQVRGSGENLNILLESRKPKPNRSRGKIAVVDLNEFILKNLVELLDIESFEAIGVVSGHTGLQLAREWLPDLIISETQLADDIDGYTFLTKLREHSDTEAIPFIFCTASADRANVQKMREMGIKDYILKPFNVDKFLAFLSLRLTEQQKLFEEGSRNTPAKKKLFLNNRMRQRKRILVLDKPYTPDEEDSKILFSISALEKANFEAMLVNNNDKYTLANLIQKLVPDLILGSASQSSLIIWALCQAPDTAMIPLIVVFNKETKADTCQRLKLYINACINEPFLEEELLQMINNQIEKSEYKKQLNNY
jgi:DNA-binding response OmpR family regulator